MEHKLLKTSRITLVSTALFALFAGPALSAPSVCKGMDEEACAAQPECRWMDSYTRKDGIQVSSHCRKGAKKAGEAQAMPKTEPVPVAVETTKDTSAAPVNLNQDTRPAPAAAPSPVPVDMTKDARPAASPDTSAPR